MRFSATEVAEGCWKATDPPTPMLNEDQFSTAEGVSCLTVRLLPDCVALACPEVTNPVTVVNVPAELAVQAPARQGMGSCAARGAVPTSSAQQVVARTAMR